MPLIVQKAPNRIILGLMTFGPKAEDGARITDLNTFNKALDVFQARGYNEIDTARTYVAGQQEAFTKQALWRERGLTLATKVKYPSKLGENAADKVVESVETSLKELGADCVDILYLHRPDRGTPFAETLEAVDRLHKAGKFVRLGISNFAAFEVAEVVMTCRYNNWVRPSVYQGMYNAITRNVEPEVFVACRRYGLDIVVYNPLAGGLFSGKARSSDMVPESGRFSDVSPSLGANYRQRYFRESTFRSMQMIEKALGRHEGLTMIETALRWMVHHSQLRFKDGNDGIIIGVSSVDQLESNLDNLEKGPLPEDVVAALDEAWAACKGESAEYWHGDLEYGYDTCKALFG
ncbi:hypothetical protein DCS_01639 [Drechmeria coniospora]|uniref:NADP-dependent oxidoreductase domain-containing protein n=1 Tax=Drechmeria coniospora TaxID=98403 RepID=A0A151GU14_DRECN|nr:hypothetical protein DCS_01639 [Drechmeria coniospora]KYK60502.1 hypothetical protein DCS_01639 [Drechmeria coniospora]ODA80657.1 hypothetical protein RJ55_03616 [Drechmeria coniospora]